MFNEKVSKNITGISVVICCFNSSTRLPKTLNFIFNQIVPDNFIWEIIIVDNNSTDSTKFIAFDEFEKSGKNIKFQIVDQPTPGLSNARIKGLEIAKYKYVCFCDDDNWLCNDYLINALKLLESNPKIGVCGGWGEEVMDSAKPFWFDQFSSAFAVGKQADREGIQPHGFVYGAGMILIKDVLLKIYDSGYKSLLTDRKGKEISSGGDTEICLLFKKEGYEVWYSPKLKFKHYIPEERLTIVYLEKLYKSFGILIAKIYSLKLEAEGSSNSYKNNHSYQITIALILLIKYTFTPYNNTLKRKLNYSLNKERLNYLLKKTKK